MDKTLPVLPTQSAAAAVAQSVIRASLRGAGRLVWLAALSAFCGCIPLRYTTSPGATGRVIDASTQAPIRGAEIAISRSTYPPDSPDKAFANKRSPTVMSNNDGGFSVPVERRVDLYCIPVDAFPRFGMLVINHDGYATTCIPFWSHAVADLGSIQIKPAAQNVRN